MTPEQARTEIEQKLQAAIVLFYDAVIPSEAATVLGLHRGYYENVYPAAAAALDKLLEKHN